MRASLPPYDDPDPWVWVRDACGGSGAYFRRSRCEEWHDGRWVLKEVARINRAERGITPDELDARTGDTTRDRREAVREDAWPGL